MKRIAFIMIVLLLFTCMTAVAQKKEVYLLFRDGGESQCQVGTLSQRSGDWKIDYKQTNYYDNGTSLSAANISASMKIHRLKK